MLENTVDEVNFVGKLWDQRSNMNTRRSSRMGKRFCSKCFLDLKLFVPPRLWAPSLRMNGKPSPSTLYLLSRR